MTPLLTLVTKSTPFSKSLGSNKRKKMKEEKERLEREIVKRFF